MCNMKNKLLSKWEFGEEVQKEDDLVHIELQYVCVSYHALCSGNTTEPICNKRKTMFSSCTRGNIRKTIANPVRHCKIKLKLLTDHNFVILLLVTVGVAF